MPENEAEQDNENVQPTSSSGVRPGQKTRYLIDEGKTPVDEEMFEGLYTPSEPEPTARDVDESGVPVDPALIEGARDADAVSPGVVAGGEDTGYVEKQSVNLRDEYDIDSSDLGSRDGAELGRVSATEDEFKAAKSSAGDAVQRLLNRGVLNQDDLNKDYAGSNLPNGNTAVQRLLDRGVLKPEELNKDYAEASQSSDNGGGAVQRLLDRGVRNPEDLNKDYAAANMPGITARDDTVAGSSAPSTGDVETSRDTSEFASVLQFPVDESTFSVPDNQGGAGDYAPANAGDTEVTTGVQGSQQPDTANPGRLAESGTSRDRSEYATESGTVQQPQQMQWSGAGGNDEYKRAMSHPEARAAINAQTGAEGGSVVGGKLVGAENARDRLERFNKEESEKQRSYVPADAAGAFGEGSELIAQDMNAITGKSMSPGGDTDASDQKYTTGFGGKLEKPEAMSPSVDKSESDTEAYKPAANSTGPDGNPHASHPAMASQPEGGGTVISTDPGNMADKPMRITGKAELTVNGIPAGELDLNLEGTGGL